jgi:hypothetical protein
MREFRLPDVVTQLVVARNQLRDHYKSAALKFEFDGNLVGDIGEAVAAEIFGIKLSVANGTGIDGVALDGRTVQVKATGTGRGPAFRHVDTRADHLLFFSFDFAALRGQIVFNGPEAVALRRLPRAWVGQRSLTPRQIAAADAEVADGERLARL